MCVCMLKVWWHSYILLVHAGGGGSAWRLSVFVLQSDDEDLHCLFNQLLPVVRKQQVVVGNAVAHRVVCTHHVNQGCKQRQGMPGGIRKRERETSIVFFKKLDNPPSTSHICYQLSDMNIIISDHIHKCNSLLI